jgi:hemerythrin superfamily protein
MATTKNGSRTKRTDVIALIRQDHRTVDDLFKKYRALGERAHKSKEQTAERIIKELSVHAAVEEQVLYPRLRDAVGSRLADHAIEEHQELKELLARLERMDPTDPLYDDLVEKVAASVTEHVQEEEAEVLPKLKAAVDRDELVAMAEAVKTAKQVAPTRPHPHAPSTPPWNVLVGTVTGVLDRAREAGRKAVRGS